MPDVHYIISQKKPAWQASKMTFNGDLILTSSKYGTIKLQKWPVDVKKFDSLAYFSSVHMSQM